MDTCSMGMTLISDTIRSILNLDVSVLMGANIASEVAQEQFCETTIGYRSEENARILKKLFHKPYFRVSCVNDVAGVEICGALKISLDVLEEEMLNGQKLQGTSAAKEIYRYIEAKNLIQEFPLLVTIYKISFEDLHPSHIVKNI
ncbi:Glycerol-3-phosphate dehydrogenase [Coelomomyces lativittatus]|nr:Glycerol-3-phosphate dehydrogenase [Coelomomyces lativittatus]